jgi:hypothetical protein
VARLDDINALADQAPGFVWRFQTESGNATDLRAYDDDRIIVNFSVWESPEALHDFVYSSGHKEVMAKRRQWFERMTDAFLVLWWVPAGHRPTIEEAVTRLEHLRAHGESESAFTFRRLFASPDTERDPARDARLEASPCPP